MSAEAIAEFDLSKQNRPLPKNRFAKSIQIATDTQASTEGLTKGNTVVLKVSKEKAEHSNHGTLAGTQLQMHRSVTPNTADFVNPTELYPGTTGLDAFTAGISISVDF